MFNYLLSNLYINDHDLVIYSYKYNGLIIANSKSQELFSLLHHERASMAFSNQQLISYFCEAQSIIEAEENVYHICWTIYPPLYSFNIHFPLP